MGFSLSPSVDIKEHDISLSIPNLPSSKTGMVLRADTGPANKIIPISTEAELVKWFGKPTAANYLDWFNAWNFLQYASSLFVVRPMEATVQNAGVALKGVNSSTSNKDGLYNSDVAELTLEVDDDFTTDKLYFYNRNVTSKQDLGLAVCSTSKYWTSPIANEFFGIVASDATNGNTPDQLNKIGGSNLHLGEIQLIGETSLVAGSKFIANNNKLFTVKNVYKDKILIDNPVGGLTQEDLALNYGTVKTALNAILVGASSFDIEFDSTKNFKMELNSVFQFDTMVADVVIGTDAPIAGESKVTVLAKVAAVDGFTVTFEKVAAYPLGVVNATAFNVGTGLITSNSMYHYFTPSPEYFVAATPNVEGSVDRFEIGRIQTIKVASDFNFPVGASLILQKNGPKTKYVGVVDDTFPNETDSGTDRTMYQIAAVDTLNNTITLNRALELPVELDATYKVDDVVTVATALRGVNLYSTIYDPSVIMRDQKTVFDPVANETVSISAESLVSFDKLLEYEPEWLAEEFLTVVLKQNASGLYDIVERKLASYRPDARDIQNRNMYANEVFFYGSNHLYARVNPDDSMAVVNTAESALIKLKSSFGAETNGVFVYGTVYPLKKGVDKKPVTDAATGLYTYDPNAYTQADVQFAEQAFADAESFDVNILVAHELDMNGMSTIAETRKDCITIVAPYKYTNLVGKTSSEATEALLKSFGSQTVSNEKVFDAYGTYSAMYGNMKYQYDKFNDVNRWMCVSGDIAGLYAMTDANRDPWWAPAGLDRGKIKNVIKLAFNANKQNRDQLYVNSINPIITVVGEGTGIVNGQKTATSRPSAIDRVNVRRLLIVIEKAIATAVKSAMFEFNDSFTRSRLVGIIDPFLRSVKSRRGVYDFLVVCDVSNNPAAVLDANGLVIDVFVKPTKVAEFITINMNITGSDANFQELVGRSA